MLDSGNVFQKNSYLVRSRLGFLKCRKTPVLLLNRKCLHFPPPFHETIYTLSPFLSHCLPLVLLWRKNLYIWHFLERRLVVKGVTSAIANQDRVHRSRDTNGLINIRVENDCILTDTWMMHSGIYGTKIVASSFSTRTLISPFVSRDLYTRSWSAPDGSDALYYSGWESGLADSTGWDYGIERKF